MALFCSGIWPIKGNVKRSLAHYKKMIPPTLQCLTGHECVFYSDSEDWLEFAVKTGKFFHVRIHPELIRIAELPGYGLARHITQRTGEWGERYAPPEIDMHEKGHAHYHRDYLKSGPAVYQKVLAIWLSKSAILRATAEHAGRACTWLDCAIAKKYLAAPQAHLGHMIFDSDKIHHFGSGMKKNGRRLQISAPVLGGGLAAIRRFDDLFSQHASLLSEEVYPNDEETIFDSILKEHPKFFALIKNKDYPQLSAADLCMPD